MLFIQAGAPTMPDFGMFETMEEVHGDFSERCLPLSLRVFRELKKAGYRGLVPARESEKMDQFDAFLLKHLPFLVTSFESTMVPTSRPRYNCVRSATRHFSSISMKQSSGICDLSSGRITTWRNGSSITCSSARSFKRSRGVLSLTKLTIAPAIRRGRHGRTSE